MELDEFRDLSISEQHDLLKDEAVYLGELKEREDIFMLYQLDKFYVEVYFREGERLTLNYFEETELLEPYFEKVDINCIYNVLDLRSY